MGQDTIDIEPLAKAFKEDFIKHYSGVVRVALLAKVPWLAAAGSPFLPLAMEFIENLIEVIGTTGGLIAFMFNTKLFTTDQGSDYIKAIQEVNALPGDVSDEVWEAAERRRIHAFSNAVNFTK